MTTGDVCLPVSNANAATQWQADKTYAMRTQGESLDGGNDGEPALLMNPTARCDDNDEEDHGG